MSVSHILGVKGRDVITGTAKETVQSIAQKLSQHRIGAVVIVDDKGAIAGIVSERDIVRALAAAWGEIHGDARFRRHEQNRQDLQGRRQRN